MLPAPPPPAVGVQTGPAPVADEAKNICLICSKQFAKYCCPKCGVKYCSLGCYKNHRADCVEAFHQEQVISSLQSMKIKSEDQKRMVMEMLKRDKDKDMEEEEERSLADLLHKLDSQEADKIYETLSESQREDFKKALRDGRLSELLQLWTPWWTRTVKIQDTSSDTTEHCDWPEVPHPLPAFSTLSRTAPHPSVRVNSVDLIFSYVITLRLFNGEPESDWPDAAAQLVQLSPVLSTGSAHTLVSEALIALQQRALEQRVGSRDSALEAINDTALVLRRTDYVLMALADAHRILKEGTAACRSIDKKWAQQLALHEKKLWFYLVWAHEQPEHIFVELSAECTAAYQRQVAQRSAPLVVVPESGATVSTSTTSKDPAPKKPLIEEL